MKNVFYYLAALVCCVFTLSSCSDNDEPKGDIIWDFAPLEIKFDILDENGNSRLNPEHENSLVGEDVSFDYEGTRHEVMWTIESFLENRVTESRACLPIFYGAWYTCEEKWDGSKWTATDRKLIRFGQFPSDDNYEITFTVNYDDRKVEVRMTRSFGWKKQEPVLSSHFFVDGVEVPAGIIELK